MMVFSPLHHLEGLFIIKFLCSQKSYQELRRRALYVKASPRKSKFQIIILCLSFSTWSEVEHMSPSSASTISRRAWSPTNPQLIILRPLLSSWIHQQSTLSYSHNLHHLQSAPSAHNPSWLPGCLSLSTPPSLAVPPAPVFATLLTAARCLVESHHDDCAHGCHHHVLHNLVRRSAISSDCNLLTINNLDSTVWSKATVTNNISLRSLKIAKKGLTQWFLESFYAAVLVFWCLKIIRRKKYCISLVC